MSELPKAPTARLMKHAGAQRISGDAVDFFVEAIEAYGMDIAARANLLAHHAGRKTDSWKKGVLEALKKLDVGGQSTVVTESVNYFNY